MISHTPSPSFWRGKRVLVTGHTGFKGAWLALWLAELGADVHGLALEPEHTRGIFNAVDLSARVNSHIGDLRDKPFVKRVIKDSQPDAVFHLAAQALVRRAHTDPDETYSTNLLGLASLLDATRDYQDLKALIVATSDKVYKNRDDGQPFTETDQLGGFEPYGVSKAAGELIVDAFRHSLPTDTKIGVATVRAGNVIGGGDWAEDRLIPDAMAAFASNKPLELRNPDSTRPWQHVLDPLAGYILLAERLSDGDKAWRSAWNFGPTEDSESHAKPVSEIADQLVKFWNSKGGLPAARWTNTTGTKHPYEAKLLSVDSRKTRDQLHWTPRISLEDALELTVAWYLADRSGENMSDHALSSLHSCYPIA